MSCAFEHACIALRDPVKKWVWLASRVGSSGRVAGNSARQRLGGRLHVYYADDVYEAHDLSSHFSPARLDHVVWVMKAWEAAVNRLHIGPRDQSHSHTCPFDMPFAMIRFFSHFTHCCSERPSPSRDHAKRIFHTCSGQSGECLNPPCSDHAQGKQVRGRNWGEGCGLAGQAVSVGQAVRL